MTTAEDRADPEASMPLAPKANPVTEPVGEGFPVPLWGDVAMRVWPEVQGTYPIEFLRGGARIFIKAPKSPPWLSPKLQEQLTAGLTSALGDEARHPDFMRRKVIEAFATLAAKLETDEGTRQALTPPTVRKVIERTERVIVYPSQATTYELTIDGRNLTITAQQMARIDPAVINAAWLNLFPTDPLNATRREWLQIQQAWTDPATVEVRKVEEVTEAETVIDRLVEDLERVCLVPDASSMTGPEFAWHDDRNGVVWVHTRRIARFLEELKRPGWNDGKLSAALQTADYTLENTRPIRIGPEAGKGKDGKQTRCWPFKPGLIEFRQPTVDQLEVSDLVQP